MSTYLNIFSDTGGILLNDNLPLYYLKSKVALSSLTKTTISASSATGYDKSRCIDAEKCNGTFEGSDYVMNVYHSRDVVSYRLTKETTDICVLSFFANMDNITFTSPGDNIIDINFPTDFVGSTSSIYVYTYAVAKKDGDVSNDHFGLELYNNSGVRIFSSSSDKKYLTNMHHWTWGSWNVRNNYTSGDEGSSDSGYYTTNYYGIVINSPTHLDGYPTCYAIFEDSDTILEQVSVSAHGTVANVGTQDMNLACKDSSFARTKYQYDYLLTIEATTNEKYQITFPNADTPLWVIGSATDTSGNSVITYDESGKRVIPGLSYATNMALNITVSKSYSEAVRTCTFTYTADDEAHYDASNAITFLVNSDKYISAKSASKKSFTVTIVQLEHETISATYNGKTYTETFSVVYGEKFSVNVYGDDTYRAGYVRCSPSGNYTPSHYGDATYNNITVLGDITLTADAAAASHTFTIVQTEHQTITVAYKDTTMSSSKSYTDTFTAYEDGSWTASITSVDDGYNAGTLSATSGNITGDITLTASSATLIPYTFTINQSNHETITVTTNRGEYTKTFTAYYGDTWTATVTPDDGYKAGILSATSGTITSDVSINVSEASQTNPIITINQKAHETIHVVTGDGIDHTSTFQCEIGTIISDVYVTVDDVSGGEYIAGSLSYTGSWKEVTTTDTLTYNYTNFPSTLVDGTNFVVSGTYAQSGSASYHVNSGHSKGYITLTGSGTAVTIKCYASSESGFDIGYCNVVEGTTPSYAGSYSAAKSLAISSSGANTSPKEYTTAVLTSGTPYTLSFGYVKDGSANSNNDRFYIESVVQPDAITTANCVDSNVTIDIGDALFNSYEYTYGGKTYKFYDSSGNIIKCDVGSSPYYYSTDGGTTKKRVGGTIFYINTSAASGSDVFYVYYPITTLTYSRWTYYSNSAFVYQSTGATGTAIGTGKTNTATVMAADSGAYITSDSYGAQTLWYYISTLNSANTNGCSDWYIPSKDEMSALQASNVASKWIPYQLWSSSENSYSTVWYQSNNTWYYSGTKHGTAGSLAIRSF